VGVGVGAGGVVVSGGRRWDRHVEADAMACELSALGVPEAVIVRERCSFSTRENARYTAQIMARRGIDRVLVVTCPWHLPRALELFARAGLRAEGFAAADAPSDGDLRRWPARALRWGVERALGQV
jgi:uncharacterized SAM-binding protein YcdF (DUF218 family)